MDLVAVDKEKFTAKRAETSKDIWEE